MKQEQSKQEIAQEVIVQNKLDALNKEHARLTKANEALDATISRKTSEYEIYINTRDSESKKLGADVRAANDQLYKDKAEFQNHLKQFQADKEAFAKEKDQHAMQSARLTAQTEAVQHFIQAIKRDITVLGI